MTKLNSRADYLLAEAVRETAIAINDIKSEWAMMNALSNSRFGVAAVEEQRRVGLKWLDELLNSFNGLKLRGRARTKSEAVVAEWVHRFMSATHDLGRAPAEFSGSRNEVLDRLRAEVRDTLLARAEQGFAGWPTRGATPWKNRHPGLWAALKWGGTIVTGLLISGIGATFFKAS